MSRSHEINVNFDPYTPQQGGDTSTHRLTTALGLKRVMNKVALKGLDHTLRLTFICREDAEALGLHEEANGDWVTAYMEPVQVEIVDEQALDFPGFMDLLCRNNRAICERENCRRIK